MGGDYRRASIPGGKDYRGQMTVTFVFCFPPVELVFVGASSNHGDWDAHWQEENSKEEGRNEPKEVMLQPRVLPLLPLHSQFGAD